MWNILTNPLHTVDFWTVNKASGYSGIFTVFFCSCKNTSYQICYNVCKVQYSLSMTQTTYCWDVSGGLDIRQTWFYLFFEWGKMWIWCDRILYSPNGFVINLISLNHDCHLMLFKLWFLFTYFYVLFSNFTM